MILDGLYKNYGADLAEFYINAHAPFVVGEITNLPPHSRVLEAGCGLGQWVFWFSRQGMDSVGVDVVSATIDAASEFAKKEGYKNTSFLCADVRNLPFESNSFDCVFSFGVIEHFKDPTNIITEFYRVLRPGGRVFLSVPNVYCPHTFMRPLNQLLGTWDIGYERSYSKVALTSVVKKCGFEVKGCGIMPGKEFFGCWARRIPVVGNYLDQFLRKSSVFIESHQKLFSFWLYVVAEKQKNSR